jgi:2-dehydropantoate 2-reductase
MPRVAVYGAGAIGGMLGAHLARTGEAEVALIARGPHLAAMRERGLTLRGASDFAVRPRCTDDPSELGPQDYVIVGLKAHAVPGVVDRMRPLLGEGTAVVFAVNGVPWWYFHRLPGPYEGRRLESVDPGGRQWDGIGPERAVGCVVYPAAEVPEPGVIEHVSGDRFVLGEPSGEATERVQALSRLLIKAGLKAPVRPRIRDEIWVKLWGNLSFNPISALTGATLDVITADPGTRALARAMMLEAQAVGERLGVRFGVDVERRIEGAAAVGAHKTSMLQDLERGRPMEIDALVTAVQEMGRLVGVATPAIDAVLALVAQRARLAGCYP